MFLVNSHAFMEDKERGGQSRRTIKPGLEPSCCEVTVLVIIYFNSTGINILNLFRSIMALITQHLAVSVCKNVTL